VGAERGRAHSGRRRAEVEQWGVRIAELPEYATGRPSSAAALTPPPIPKDVADDELPPRARTRIEAQPRQRRKEELDALSKSVADAELAEALLASGGRSGASGGRTALGGAIDFGQSGGQPP
jgi:type IV secretory pathway VirB10-like protein